MARTRGKGREWTDSVCLGAGVTGPVGPGVQGEEQSWMKLRRRQCLSVDGDKGAWGGRGVGGVGARSHD